MNKELIELHKTNIKQWRITIATAIRENPNTFGIMDFGKNDDGNLLLSKEEFTEHFKGTYNDTIIDMIWDEMEKTDSNEVKFTTIHRFIQKSNIKSPHRRRESVHVC